MEFTNEQIDINSLPSIIDIEYTGLHKKYLKSQLISTALIFSLLLIGFTLVYIFGDLSALTYPMIIPGVLLLVGIIILIAIYLGFRIKAYAIRENDVIYKKGLVFRSQTVVPFHRVQHCELDQGPLERYFGLKTLKIFTAGGSNSDLNIPGLKEEEAESLKSYIIQRSDNKTLIEEVVAASIINEEE